MFTTSFNWGNLLPRWELWTWLPKDQQGFWPLQKGIVTIVEQGTPGSYWQPGVLIMSGVIQVLGYMFFINTKWGRKLKLTLEDVFFRNTKILSKYRYLISDDNFKENFDTDSWDNHTRIKKELLSKDYRDEWIPDVFLIDVYKIDKTLNLFNNDLITDEFIE